MPSAKRSRSADFVDPVQTPNYQQGSPEWATHRDVLGVLERRLRGQQDGNAQVGIAPRARGEGCSSSMHPVRSGSANCARGAPADPRREVGGLAVHAAVAFLTPLRPRSTYAEFGSCPRRGDPLHPASTSKLGSRTGLAAVRSLVLEPLSAARLYGCMEADVPWSLTYNEGDKSVFLDAALQERGERKRQELWRASCRAQGHFQYLFSRLPMVAAYLKAATRTVLALRVRVAHDSRTLQVAENHRHRLADQGERSGHALPPRGIFSNITTTRLPRATPPRRLRAVPDARLARG